MITYNNFKSSLLNSIYGSNSIQEQFIEQNHIIQSNNSIFINNQQTYFNNIPEAIDFINRIELYEDLVQENFNKISDERIASIISEHHNVRITNTLIEEYRNLIRNKSLSFDPVVKEIRNLNPLMILNDKIDFILEDGVHVAISNEMYLKLVDKYNEDIRESFDVFTKAIQELLELSNGKASFKNN